MKLLIGLGNPGRKYNATRHNIGFNVVDLIADELNVEITKKKFQSLFGIGKIGENDICIVKPQTFMNLSGKAAAEFAGHYKVDVNNILVVQDDIDMPFAKIKFISKSGAGGHNGISSIIDRLGTNEFFRLKVGIGRPREGLGPADHVLDKFEADERKTVEKLIKTSAESVKEFFINGPESAMQKYNNRETI